MEEKMSVEVGVATYEGDLQTWFTTFVEIPVDTLDDDILDTATEVYLNEHPDVTVAGIFVLGTYPGEEDDDGFKLDDEPFDWDEEEEGA